MNAFLAVDDLIATSVQISDSIQRRPVKDINDFILKAYEDLLSRERLLLRRKLENVQLLSESWPQKLTLSSPDGHVAMSEIYSQSGCAISDLIHHWFFSICNSACTCSYKKSTRCSHRKISHLKPKFSLRISETLDHLFSDKQTEFSGTEKNVLIQGQGNLLMLMVITQSSTGDDKSYL